MGFVSSCVSKLCHAFPPVTLGSRSSPTDAELSAEQREELLTQFNYDNHILYPKNYETQVEKVPEESKKWLLKHYGINNTDADLCRVVYKTKTDEVLELKSLYLLSGDEDQIALEKIGDTKTTTYPRCCSW